MYATSTVQSDYQADCGDVTLCGSKIYDVGENWNHFRRLSLHNGIASKEYLRDITFQTYFSLFAAQMPIEKNLFALRFVCNRKDGQDGDQGRRCRILGCYCR